MTPLNNVERTLICSTLEQIKVRSTFPLLEYVDENLIGYAGRMLPFRCDYDKVRPAFDLCGRDSQKLVKYLHRAPQSMRALHRPRTKSLFFVCVQPLSHNRGNGTVDVMMTVERWRQIKSIYDAVRDQPLAKRARFLARACGSDGELREQVEAMLMADNYAERNIETHVPAVMANPIAGPPALEPAAALSSGDLLANYELIREIGR